jgi:hypothetical protein
VTAGSGAIFVSPNISNRSFTIARNSNTPATTPLQVGVASGNRSASVTVNLTGEALNTNCDLSSLRVTPSSVTLASCGPVDVTVTGGNPPYAPRSDNSSVTATMVTANIVRIQRAVPSASFTPPASVTVTDNSGLGVSRTISVSGTGTGAGSGQGSCP